MKLPKQSSRSNFLMMASSVAVVFTILLFKIKFYVLKLNLFLHSY